MRSAVRNIAFGLVWVSLSIAAFGADAAPRDGSSSETGLFAVTGAGLILLSLLRRRAKD